MQRYTNVEDYIAGHPEWQKELTTLRAILNDTALEETVKWGGPCYTANGKNIVGLGAFKEFFTLWFYQGALLKDEKGVLINAQEGTTKALRQWRFTSLKEVKKTWIKAYINEAIKNERAGRRITADRSKPLIIPPELKSALNTNRLAKSAFAQLTKGKQREYIDYIASAKRPETKAKRLEKAMPLLLSGVGLNDKYRRS